MPKIADIETTPNPNAMKFILKEPLSWGVSHSYENLEHAQNDPLASALFAIEHITNVFYIDHWITVTQDGGADWQQLSRLVAEPIRLAAAADAQSTSVINKASDDLAQLSAADQQRLCRINEILDEQIRPYLQKDGGDIYVTGLDGDILSVRYQGACGSCPSSLSGTLAAITNLLRSIEPAIEVIAV